LFVVKLSGLGKVNYLKTNPDHKHKLENEIQL